MGHVYPIRVRAAIVERDAEMTFVEIVVVKRQADLLKVVFAGNTPGRFAHLLDSRQQETDQDRNNRDDDKKLNEREGGSGVACGHYHDP
jgi:hypothetical protein